MPIHKTSDGKWQYGTTGKKYTSKSKAELQMRAIKASESREKEKKRK